MLETGIEVEVFGPASNGILMDKYTGPNKFKSYVFRLDQDLGQIVWQSTKKLRISELLSFHAFVLYLGANTQFQSKPSRRCVLVRTVDTIESSSD